MVNHKAKEILRAFEKFNNQPRSNIEEKGAKSKIKPAIFTTQYNPLGHNINCIIKKHPSIITDNLNLLDMFLKDSVFCAYQRFLNLSDLMMRADLYI